MPSKLNAISTGTPSLKFTAAGDGALEIQNDGNTAITISNTGIATFAQPSVNPVPTFFVYRGTPNQTLTIDLWQKAAMDTVLYDSEGWYDETTNYRYTPQIAGWYQFNLECFLSASSGATVTGCAVGKNGVDGVGILSNYSAIAGGTGGSAMCSGLVYLNGTSDYAEAFMQASGVSPSLRGGTLSLGAAPPPVTVYMSSWSGFLVRAT